MKIETIPMPADAALAVEFVPLPPRGKQTKPKPAKVAAKPDKVGSSIRNAAADYKQAYKALFGLNPRLTYDGKWIRVSGMAQGVSVRRLQEMTKQLKNRKG